MRRLLFLLVLLLVLPLAVSAQPLPDDVVASVQARVEAGENEGVFVGVVGPEGTRTASFGRLSAERPEAPDSATVFEIGSVTKVFTALLLAEMAGRGEVALDDPIAQYLPDTLDVAFADRVTLRHLATHTSGLPRMPANFASADPETPYDPENPYTTYPVEALYRFLASYELPRAPGAEYEYSNLATGLLGHLLAAHAGASYEALLRERVLDPLGLDDTAVTLSADQQERLARGHAEGRPVPNWDFLSLGAAGALRSTGADMLRFLRANLGFIDPSGPLAEALAQVRGPRIPAYGDSIAVALGWHTRTSPNAEVIWHNGGTGGYKSFVGFDPASRRGVVVLTNSNRSMDDVGFHLLDPAFPLTPPAETADVPVETLERYVGTYMLGPGFTITVTREDDRLYAQATGQQAFRLYPASETEFFLRTVDARVTFHLSDEGAVERLIMHQDGRDMPAPKTQ